MQAMATEAPRQLGGPSRRAQISTNVWDTKPVWCQPWSILLTGGSIIAGANALSHGTLLWTALAAGPILVWWFVFLVALPAEYKDYVEAQLDAMQEDRTDL